VANENASQLEATRRHVSRSLLLLVKLVLRMNKNCYFATYSDFAIRFSGTDFLKRAMISFHAAALDLECLQYVSRDQILLNLIEIKQSAAELLMV